MRARTAIIVAVAGLIAGGCGLQKQRRTYTVLRTDDFIDPAAGRAPDADPHTPSTPPSLIAEGTLPEGEITSIGEAPEPPLETPAALTAPASDGQPGSGRPPAFAGIGAGDGLLEVTPGAPEFEGGAPPPAEPPEIVDAVVGEINGRPVRIESMLDQAGDRLRAIARKRRLTADEWGALLGGSRRQPVDEAYADRTPLDRSTYLRFAEGLFKFLLERELEQELLAEEARFSLKPEQRQGLKAFVQEFSETQRRQAGGSREAAARRLREKENLTPDQFARAVESEILIDHQLRERIKKRVQVSWKDVQLYYDRHPEIYNPPKKAYFRLIRVPESDGDAIARVRAALEAGTPFAEVAAMPENQYNRAEGGRTDPRPVTGAYHEADLFPGELGAAAQKLAVGGWTHEPVTTGSAATWLFLERIEDNSRPLSDRDVQIGIATQLNRTAEELARRDYIQQLKERASYTNIEVMARALAEMAADRYWPAE